MALTFNGYIPLRRGLLQHLRERRISLREYDVFTILLMWADHRTGIATTNAPGLVFLSGGQLEQSYVQKCLASLEEKNYIKRPFYVIGQRGDYKIFIDKYVVTDGALKGKTLSFAKTMDWNDPQYEDVTEDATESTTEDATGSADGNADSNKKLRTENGKGKRNKAGVQRGGQGEKDPKQHQEQPPVASLNQPSGEQQQQPNPRGAAPNPAEGFSPSGLPGTSSPVNSASPRPHSAPPRNRVVDMLMLNEAWPKLIYSYEKPVPGYDEYDRAGRADLERLLASTDDSVETILAVAKWGIEISDHWFDPKRKGIIRTFTDFVNAYAPMSKQYKTYQAKANKGGAV
jgi:hypothetical protein